jgi:phosphoglycolate phosphatase-like HAD superfamily hydrolase
MRHVVWDWNGTLFDDQHLVLEGLNAVLADAGMPPTDLDTYRRLYTRPVRVFYERIFGRPIPDEEWDHLDEVYHAVYRDGLSRATLARDAEVALRAPRETGQSQSLLSMWRHHELVPLVTELGIDDHFVRVDGLGVDGAGQGAGGAKAPHLEAHLRRVVHAAGDDPTRVLVVGDALDDAVAAAHVGARCVLYDGGSHPRAELETAGVPVASSLTEALERGGIG